MSLSCQLSTLVHLFPWISSHNVFSLHLILGGALIFLFQYFGNAQRIVTITITAGSCRSLFCVWIQIIFSVFTLSSSSRPIGFLMNLERRLMWLLFCKGVRSYRPSSLLPSMIALQDSTLTPGAMHCIESEQTSNKESHIFFKLDCCFHGKCWWTWWGW